jgi:hypothetical protein
MALIEVTLKEFDPADEVPIANIVGYEHWGGPAVKISYRQGDHRWELGYWTRTEEHFFALLDRLNVAIHESLR